MPPVRDSKAMLVLAAKPVVGLTTDGARAGPAPHVEDRAGVLVVVGKVVGKGRAALLHAWT